MIETGTIVELANKTKYIITDSSMENTHIYYLALEVDYDTEEPKNESMFFEHDGDSLIPVTEDGDVEFLKTIFVNRFLKEFMDNEEE